MKRYNIYKLLATAIVLITISSCKKSFFTDVNRNPNAVTSVPGNLLLPSVEASLAFVVGGDFSRNTSLIDQQVYGEQNQSQTFYQYGINPGTFENMWADMYTSTMENNYTLKLLSSQSGLNEYNGIADMLLAYELQLTVDTWGSVPYSEALKGNLPGGTIKPKYDSDQALYDTIAVLVDSGIARLQLADPGPIVPSTDDVMYGGDASKWIKFGHAIKARLYIHQSKGDATMAANALTEVAASFADETESAVYHWLGDGNTTNPWAQFLSNRANYITFNKSTLTSIMTGLNDPRLPLYVDQTNDLLGAYYGSASSPTEFITYDELQFIKAEAILRSTGDQPSAQAAYVAGITADMTKVGVAAGAITTYLAANGTLPAGDAGIAKNAEQEYIALFLNPEAWTVYRRTGTPNLAPTGPGVVPRRFLYPQSEYSYNAGNVPPSTLTTPKIFWDK